jgi:hypothetical protein
MKWREAKGHRGLNSRRWKNEVTKREEEKEGRKYGR